MLMTTDLHESKCMYPGVSVDEVYLWIGCCTQMPKKAQTLCGAGNRPLACKARGMQLVLIAFYVISGLLCGRVKCIAVKGEIASAHFRSVARRAQYRIFLFRERSIKLKSSACLPVFARSRRDERSRSYSS